MNEDLVSELLRLIDRRVERRSGSAPPLEVARGVVMVVKPGPRTLSARLDGAAQPTPGIVYPTGMAPLVGDQVLVLRRRDGLLVALHVLGRDSSELGYQREPEKGQPGGYASLDEAGLVPTAQLGSGTADGTTFLRGDQTYAALPSAAPTDADYLVGTAHGGLSSEIVVGATPGGELGGTWASPTVDVTHSGSAHHAQAHGLVHADHPEAGLTAGHVVRATGATTYAFGAIQDGDIPATIARDTEVTTAVSDHAAAADPHTGYLLESAHGGVSPTGHHAQSHVLATGTALGPDHTISGAAAGEVLRALSATTAAFDQLGHGDLGGVTSDQHHARSHDHSAAADGTALVPASVRTGASQTDMTDPPLVVARAGTAMLIYRASADIFGPNLWMAKARGTFDARAAAQNGDGLGNWEGRGWDGAANGQHSYIGMNIDGVPGASDYPGRIVFATTLDGAASATIQWRIDNAGHLRPATDSAVDLGITGNRVRSIYADMVHLGDPISPAQLTADTNDYNPTGGTTAYCWRLSTDASRNLTGIAGGVSGALHLLVNVGSFDLVLVHDATSTAANRFLCPGSANVTVNANDSVHIWYDTTSSRWRVVGL